MDHQGNCLPGINFSSPQCHNVNCDALNYFINWEGVSGGITNNGLIIFSKRKTCEACYIVLYKELSVNFYLFNELNNKIVFFKSYFYYLIYYLKIQLCL